MRPLQYFGDQFVEVVWLEHEHGVASLNNVFIEGVNESDCNNIRGYLSLQWLSYATDLLFQAQFFFLAIQKSLTRSTQTPTNAAN